jgi:hypothetical protein
VPDHRREFPDRPPAQVIVRHVAARTTVCRTLSADGRARPARPAVMPQHGTCIAHGFGHPAAAHPGTGDAGVCVSERFGAG